MVWNTSEIFAPPRLLFTNIFPVFSRWVQTGSLQAASHISSLSWNLEGTRLLTGGVVLQLWHERINQEDDDEPANGKI